MLFALFTDWGTGQKLSFLWLLPSVWLFYHALKRYRMGDNMVGHLALAAAVLWTVVSVALVFDSESNRRETAQLRTELTTKLDVTVEQVNTSGAYNVVVLDDCRVRLDVRRHDAVWMAAIAKDAEAFVPIGPKLQTRLEAYCATKQVTE